MDIISNSMKSLILIFAVGISLLTLSVISILFNPTTTVSMVPEVVYEELDLGDPMKKEFDRSSEKIEIRVHTYDTVDEVTKEYINHNIYSGDDRYHDSVRGWALFYKKSPGEPHYCEIFVTEPKTTKDKYMSTWGHELMHCVYGEFHKITEPKQTSPKD